jgi:hypothetical protein
LYSALPDSLWLFRKPAAWWSPFEPYGEVARLLEGTNDFEIAIARAESPSERTLYLWAAGTKAARAGTKKQAAIAFKRGVEACPADDTLMRDLLCASLWFECGESSAHAKKKPIADPFDPTRDFFNALECGDWKKAKEAGEIYFAIPRRESATMLGMGLFRCQLEGFHQSLPAERQALQRFRQEIHNPWYQRIADCLMGDADPDATLASVAGKRPETITLAVALGLQAELLNDEARALDYYRTALDTGQQNWFEYRFAQARRAALKKSQ